MRAMDAFNEAIMLVDMELAAWTIMFTNDAWLRVMSASPHLLCIFLNFDSPPKVEGPLIAGRHGAGVVDNHVHK